ncbi:isoprenylcysteine carboxylmethyltransferase family protein [Fibrella sp. WM1]|uniref:methyltransferase family protein n=1 Tax=Fibrella musci TaxID=3242485 RepID=UPI0035218078
MYAYPPLLLSWLLFGLIHSLTAANGVKGWMTLRVGLPIGYYRLCYNLLSVLTFLPVLWALQTAPTDWLTNGRGLPWLGTLLLMVGGAVGILALRQYDLALFIGWPPGRQQNPTETLQQNGLLRYVRHPLYLGVLIGLAGLVVWQPDRKHLLFGLLAFVYIRIGIYFEERKLVAVFGEAYQRYQQQTPMLLPSSRLS